MVDDPGGERQHASRRRAAVVDRGQPHDQVGGIRVCVAPEALHGPARVVQGSHRVGRTGQAARGKVPGNAQGVACVGLSGVREAERCLAVEVASSLRRSRLLSDGRHRRRACCGSYGPHPCDRRPPASADPDRDRGEPDSVYSVSSVATSVRRCCTPLSGDVDCVGGPGDVGWRRTQRLSPRRQARLIDLAHDVHAPAVGPDSIDRPGSPNRAGYDRSVDDNRHGARIDTFDAARQHVALDAATFHDGNGSCPGGCVE